MAHTYEDRDIDTTYFTDNRASGGEGGYKFTYVLHTGAILKKIRAWKKDWRIGGVEVTMTDGSKRMFGTQTGSPSEFAFYDGERITTIDVQASGPYSSELKRRRLGAISLKTNQSRSWEIKSKKLDGEGHFWPDVGEGVCCGIFGAHGDDVDRLGFAFLRPIQRAVLTNVTYPNLDLEIVASQPETVVSEVFSNNTDVEQTFILRESRSVTTTRSWSVSATLSLSVSVTVSAGIPLVASVDETVSWGVSATSTYDLTTSVTEVAEWEWPVVCPPRTQVHATATMYADDIDTEYEADMEIYLNTGELFKYKEKGVYSGLNSRSGEINIEDLGPI